LRVTLSQPIAAPRRTVWDVLTDWERQAEWMVDALAVEVITPYRTGVGVTVVCPTRILGVTVRDVLRVTRWVEDEVLEVVHLGKVIKGTAAFELHDSGTGTRVEWWEHIDPPLGAFGALVADRVIAPLTAAVFRRSLRRFAALCEREPRPEGT
jgi:carbon monoxide dehydrogenase subunit G